MTSERFNHLYSVRDRVSGTYSEPYMFYGEQDMRRKIATAYCKNPFSNDLEVYSVGCYDPLTGVIVTSPEAPIFVQNVVDIIKEYTDNAQA